MSSIPAYPEELSVWDSILVSVPIVVIIVVGCKGIHIGVVEVKLVVVWRVKELTKV